MSKTSPYLSFIQKELKKNHIPDAPSNLYDPIRYFLDMKGKKIRPILTLLSAELFGGTMEQAKHAALSIEIFHNFTLIHDDIMDEAPIRRGIPTVHEKWNNNIAILSGDVMFVMAYEQLSLCQPNILRQLLKTFNNTAIEVCEGQQMDMDFENQESISQENYIEMIRLKTSVLLGCALEMGAIVCGASDENKKLIYDFGVNIGIAFQIQDDLLDLYGDTKKVGKQTGGDVLANKNTLLSILAEMNSNDEQRLELKRLRKEKDATSKIEGVKSIFDDLDIKSKCTEVMQSYYEKALKSFSEIKTKNKNNALLELSNALMNRDF
jgi:geranylgeranyl diphosphate synthase type II